MEKLLGTILGGPIGGFLTSLLSAVIRPIIQAEIQELKNEFIKNQKFKEFDKEVDEYLPKLASATLSEDRWALVQELKNKRANLTK